MLFIRIFSCFSQASERARWSCCRSRRRSTWRARRCWTESRSWRTAATCRCRRWRRRGHRHDSCESAPLPLRLSPAPALSSYNPARRSNLACHPVAGLRATRTIGVSLSILFVIFLGVFCVFRWWKVLAEEKFNESNKNFNDLGLSMLNNLDGYWFDWNL